MRLKHSVGLFLFFCAGFLYGTNLVQTPTSSTSDKQQITRQQEASPLIVIDKAESFAEIDFEEEDTLFSANFVLAAPHVYFSNDFNSLHLFRGYSYAHSSILFKLFRNFRI